MPENELNYEKMKESVEAFADKVILVGKMMEKLPEIFALLEDKDAAVISLLDGDIIVAPFSELV